jgi:hypothetical protein
MLAGPVSLLREERVPPKRLKIMAVALLITSKKRP